MALRKGRDLGMSGLSQGLTTLVTHVNPTLVAKRGKKNGGTKRGKSAIEVPASKKQNLASLNIDLTQTASVSSLAIDSGNERARTCQRLGRRS